MRSRVTIGGASHRRCGRCWLAGCSELAGNATTPQLHNAQRIPNSQISKFSNLQISKFPNFQVPLLHLQHASLAFGHLPLFENADLRIDAGERIALIGRNGTGKSSLLKALAGDVPLDSGTVWREPGLRVARLDQEVAIESARGTVRDEIARGLGPLADLESEESWRHEQKLKLVISRLGLPAERLVSELSGGWRRRTLLAKALVAEP